MLKLMLFYLIWRITGNPILAIIVLLVIYYAVDRRYIGLLPSVTAPFRRWSRMSYLRKQLQINPYDAPVKQDLASAYITAKQYRKALQLLEELPPAMQTSAEVLYNIGLCHLAQGDTATGEQLVLQALAQNDQLRFGEPYLSLATAFAETNPQKAMEYLQAFHTQNTSSCESYYRKATIHAQLGDKLAAIDDWHRCIETYQFLPNFRKRKERRWAVKARLRLWVTRR